MPIGSPASNPLQIVRDIERAQQRDAEARLALEGLRAAPKPATTPGPPEPPEPTYDILRRPKAREVLGTLGAPAAVQYLDNLNTALLSLLPDQQVIEHLGLPPDISAQALKNLRFDPSRYLAQYPEATRQRYNRLADRLAPLGGIIEADLDPQFVYNVRQMREALAPAPIAGKQVPGLLRLATEPLRDAWQVLFGDGSTFEPKGYVTPDGFLLDQSDQWAYLSSRGILGAAADVAQVMLVEPAAAVVTTSSAMALSAMFGVDTKLLGTFEAKVKEGVPVTTAMFDAYRESDLWPGVKGSLEFLLTVVPFGGVGAVKSAAAVAVALPKGLAKGLIPGLRVGTKEAAAAVMRVIKSPKRAGAIFIRPLVSNEELSRTVKPAATLDIPEHILAYVQQKGITAAKSVVNVVNPEAVAQSPVGRAALMRQKLLVQTKDWATNGRIALQSFAPFLKLKDGYVTAATKLGDRSTDIAVMWETPLDKLDELYRFDSLEARQFFDVWRRLQEEMQNVKLAEGVLLDTVPFYSPRNITFTKSALKQLREDMRRGGVVRIGAKQRFQFGRDFEDIVDGIKAGIPYDRDVMAVWDAQVSSVGRAVADKRFVELLQAEGVTSTLKDVKTLRTAVKDVKSAVNAALGGNEEALSKINLPEVQQMLASPDKLDKLRVFRAQLDKEVNDLSDVLLTAKEGFRLPWGGRAIKEIAFDERTAQELLQHLRRDPHLLSRAVHSLGDALRLSSTTLDFSGLMLQGLPVLLTKPREWAAAAEKSFEVFGNWRARTKYLADNLETVRDFMRAGGEVGTSEFYAAATGFLGGAYKRPGAAQAPLRGLSTLSGKVLTPFQRSFDTFGDVARIELFKALAPMAQNDGELAVIAKFTNKMTGAFNTTRMGVMPGQRALESFLLFSPRYLRAGLALLTDVFRGGMTGNTARTALTTMLSVGFITYMGLTRLFDQKPRLDPRAPAQGGDGPAFMALEIAGQFVGWGSQWISMLRLFANIYGKLLDNPEGHVVPSDITDPIARFMWGKAAPLPGIGIDALVGHTYIGERVDRGDLANFAYDMLRLEATRALPMVVQRFAEGDLYGVADRAVTLVAEMAGLRTFPAPASELMHLRADELAQANYGVDAEDVYKGDIPVKSIEQAGWLGMRRVLDADPVYQEYMAQWKAKRLDRGGEADAVFDELQQGMETIAVEYDGQLAAAATEFTKPGGRYYHDGPAFVDRVSAINQAAAVARRQKRNEPRFAELLARLREASGEKQAKAELFAGDLAYLEYQDTVAVKDYLPVAEGGYQYPDGTVDWDTRAAEQQQIVARWSKQSGLSELDILNYIEARQKYRSPGRSPLPPVVELWYESRDTVLRQYWDIPKRLFPDDPKLLEYLRTSSMRRSEMLREDSRLKSKEARVADARESWRRTHPEGVALLALFGSVKASTWPELRALQALYKRIDTAP